MNFIGEEVLKVRVLQTDNKEMGPNVYNSRIREWSRLKVC